MTLFKLIVLSSKKFMNAHEASDAQLLTHPQKEGEGEEGEQVWLPSGAPVFLSLTQPHSGVRVLPLFFSVY